MWKTLGLLLSLFVGFAAAQWKDPQGKPIPSFEILTPNPDYDPVRALAGTLIGQWLQKFGFPAQTKPLPFGTIVEKVNERNFDTFILGWSLSLDPDYVREFFHSKQDVKDGYNSVGFHNKAFDELADESARTCDVGKRQKLIFNAQKMLMEKLPYVPLYFRNEIESYNNKTFEGWFEDLGGISGSIIYLQPKTKQRILRIGVQDEPKTLNIFNTQDVWTSHVVGWFYETLFTREPLTHKIVPWIAQGDPEYEGQVATVKIKPGVRWDDGTELTAEDVKFTADAIMKLKLPRFISSYEFIEKVEAKDKYTILYTLKESCTPLFLENTLMSLIVQKKKWQPIFQKALQSKDPLKAFLEHPIQKPESNGPFLLEKWVKGGFVKLKANPNYFFKGKELGGKKVGPFLDGILFKIYRNTSTAILALKKGELDYFWWPLQPESVGDVKQVKHLTVTNSPGNGFFYLGFNLRKKPFSDLAFRKAIALLIDKEEIVKVGLKGYGEGAYSVVPPGNRFWFNPSTPKLGKGLTRKEREKKAREILVAAGYTYGGSAGSSNIGMWIGWILLAGVILLLLVTRKKHR